MPFPSCARPVDTSWIEAVARTRLNYEIILQEQSEILSTDRAAYDAAVTRVQQSPLVCKPGQRWEPEPENVDAYIAYCDSLCSIKPCNFDDRVKIMHGAFASLMAIMEFKIGSQPERVQLAIIKKHAELVRLKYPVPSTTAINDTREPPISKPSDQSRRLTTEELQLFEDPERLHGQKFLFSPLTEDSGMYEVVGYSRGRDKFLRYELLFDDCEDPVVVDSTEMRKMLTESHWFVVS